MAVQYAAQMKGYASELIAACKTMDDDELYEYIMNRFNAKYNSLVASINAVPSTTLNTGACSSKPMTSVSRCSPRRVRIQACPPRRKLPPVDVLGAATERVNSTMVAVMIGMVGMIVMIATAVMTAASVLDHKADMMINTSPLVVVAVDVAAP